MKAVKKVCSVQETFLCVTFDVLVVLKVHSTID